jgi:hypothetical protein
LASQVWRGCPAVAAHWAQVLAEAGDDREMARARRCWLLSPKPTPLPAATSPTGAAGCHEVWAHWAGVANGPQPRRLHGERPLHIRFGRAQHRAQQADEPSWRKRIWRLHPTWNGGQVHHAGHMGGPLEALCGSCHAPLQRLLRDRRCRAAAGRGGRDHAGALPGLLRLGRAAGAFLSPRWRRLPSCHPSQYREVPNTPTDSGDLMQAEVGLVAWTARAGSNRTGASPIIGRTCRAWAARPAGCRALGTRRASIVARRCRS